MIFVLPVSVLFLANCYELSISIVHVIYFHSSCTQVTIWIIRQRKIDIDVAGKITYKLSNLHPCYHFCRHIIPTLHFISLENVFGFYCHFLLLIKLYPCNNVVLVNQN